MKKFSFLVVVLFLGIQTIQSQKNINNYAYVVVPEQFPFQGSEDQYQLNSLAKFLFKRTSMNAYKSTEKIPIELLELDCGGLRMKVNKESNAFRIKVSFELLDCRNQVVFKSEIGSSLEKEFKKGYHQSLRNAFKSFEALKYKYDGQLALKEKVVKKMKPNVIAKKGINNSDLVYSNENLSILLKENSGSFLGNVVKSGSMNYAEGDLICKLFKTSLANVYRVEWKDAYGNFIHTIGYFDESGSLNIDFQGANGVDVMVFSK
jgi:hypothetical protein